MMASPIWDEEVRSVIIAIRGNPPRGTMWSVTPGQYKKLRDKMMPKSIPDSIEKKIKASLKKLGAKSSGLNAAVCTHRVMRKMGLLGKKLGFTVHGIGDNSQWLYDQCWTDEDEIGIIQKLPLAMECEWSCGGILGDFQKLVVSRADHRFLVCSHGSPEASRDCVNDLVDQVRHYQGTKNGDRYLFAHWDSCGWEFRSYIHPAIAYHGQRVWLFQANNEFILTKELKRRRKVGGM